MVDASIWAIVVRLYLDKCPVTWRPIRCLKESTQAKPCYYSNDTMSWESRMK
jgi:hypothetical protein